jgi:hypothetical protein
MDESLANGKITEELRSPCLKPDALLLSMLVAISAWRELS